MSDYKFSEIEMDELESNIRENERAKVLDVVSSVLAKMNNICGRSCPVDCEWGTDESCKEQWKKYLAKQLDEQSEV